MGSEIHKRDLVGAGFDEPKLVAYCLRPIACGLLLVAYCLWPIERQPFRCLELRAFSMIGEPRSRRQRFAGGFGKSPPIIWLAHPRHHGPRELHIPRRTRVAPTPPFTLARLPVGAGA